MSYQYPPQDGSEIGVSQAGYMGSHLTPTSHLEGNQMSPARRRESLSKEFKLKRSVSTPNVRPQGTNEADHGPLGLSNEKKRNKLGYHRTPIACGHCRKRKIRCKQPEVPDVLGRCESCINLGRDCVYAAVNQPPPPAPGQRQGTRASVGTSLASPSTSPAMPSVHALETQSNPPYQHLATVPSTPNMGQQSMESGENETYSTETKIPPNASSGRALSYGHGTSGWMPTDARAGAARASGDTNASWTNFAHGLPETSELSSYTSHAPPSSLSTWPANSLGLSRIDTNTRLDDTWKSYASTTRSMSYSDEHYVSPSARSYDRAHATPETSLGSQGSLSAGAGHHPTYGTWPQPYQYAKPGEDYAGWYDDHEGHHPGAHVSSTAEDPSQAGGAMYYGGR
ncbi:hypothetical protein F4677DRAFT_464753 [Hypoxylon crocopeplum]|nr:hypothetical protein F4677DRAFT_464753 [Hypoxylon crocopeplum]